MHPIKPATQGRGVHEKCYKESKGLVVVQALLLAQVRIKQVLLEQQEGTPAHLPLA